VSVWDLVSDRHTCRWHSCGWSTKFWKCKGEKVSGTTGEVLLIEIVQHDATMN
jgi:hypothetical protein